MKASYHFTIDMSPELWAQLNKSAALSGLSRAEVFREAIGLYTRWMEGLYKNEKLVFISSEGNQVEICRDKTP